MPSFLTLRQKEILDFLRNYREEHGLMPTHREICEQFGYSSYGTVHKHLKLLEKKGYLKRHWNQKRGVELIEADTSSSPGGVAPQEGSTRTAEAGEPSFAAGQRRDFQQSALPPGAGTSPVGATVELPFFGLVAAGFPIEVIALDDRVTVPNHLLEDRRGPHFVLKVRGDSMIGEGIHDGDLIVVERRSTASLGEMVVARVGTEATLKRFFPEGDKVRLEPANPEMPSLWVEASEFAVEGVVAGLMRKF